MKLLFIGILLLGVANFSFSQCSYKGNQYNVGSTITFDDGTKHTCKCIIDVPAGQSCNARWEPVTPPPPIHPFVQPTVTPTPTGTYLPLSLQFNNSPWFFARFYQIIPFGSSLNDVLIKEYGNGRSGTINYQNLGISTECTNNEIRYYYRNLNGSVYDNYIEEFLRKGDLNRWCKNVDLTYSFLNNRLIKLTFRFFYEPGMFNNFYESFCHNLGVYSSTDRGYLNWGDDFFVYTAHPGEAANCVEIVIGDKNTETFCNFCWYSNPVNTQRRIFR